MIVFKPIHTAGHIYFIFLFYEELFCRLEYEQIINNDNKSMLLHARCHRRYKIVLIEPFSRLLITSPQNKQLVIITLTRTEKFAWGNLLKFIYD